MIERPWTRSQAHPRKDDIRRLILETLAFVWCLGVVVVLIGLAGPA